MKKQRNLRAFWMQQLHQWHWVSSALSLVGMLLFAVTGITLNNAAHIAASPEVTRVQAQLPAALQLTLIDKQAGEPIDEAAALPAAVANWLRAEIDVAVAGKSVEWSDDEVYVSLPRPGGDAWLTIDRQSGAVEYELTRRGAVAYLNDLHKGRHTGTAWSWFLDVFSVACIVFCLTGLCLLYLHGRRRPATWPVVGTGLLIPLLLAMFFIH